MIYNVGSKKQDYKLSPLDLTKEYIQKLGQIDFKERMIEISGFLPMVLLTEIQEIIRRKYQQWQSEKYNERYMEDLKRRILELMALLFDIMRNAYSIDKFEDENTGYMMLYITNAMLKE